MAKRPVKSLNLNTDKLKNLTAEDAQAVAGASNGVACGNCSGSALH